MNFVIIDGDDIGNKVERHLLGNDIGGFAAAAKLVSDSVESLAEMLRQTTGVEVVSVGGDSVLAIVGDEAVSALCGVIDGMQNPGVITFSAGIGSTLRDSFVALRMAKSSGKSRIHVLASSEGSQ